MNRVRLLPIVIVAASGLLVLKAIELVSSGGQMMAAEAPPPLRKTTTVEELPKFARALVRQRIMEPGDLDYTGSVQGGKKDDKKGEAKKEEAKKDEGKQEPKKEEAKKEEARKEEPRPADPLPPTPTSERAVLERLQERRGAIDERAREMDMRESLLQAAERKLDNRINDLREIENRLDAGAKAEKAEIDRQLKTVVVMYESMKAKDAARVFDRLKLDVLVPIATAMKPARMAEIMAAMSPEAAEKLTVALASRGIEQRAGGADAAALAATPPGELPRLDSGQAKPRR
jgi:flagellar motility protein MotE (MotC chaperone)